MSIYVCPIIGAYFNESCTQVRCITAKEERSRIVDSCHTDPTSGHLGIKKTVARISERFIWPGIIRDVNELVSYTIIIPFNTLCNSCSRQVMFVVD